MKTLTKSILLAAGMCSTSLVFGQQNSYNDRYDQYDRPSRRDERRDDRRLEDRLDERREYNRREQEEPKYNNRYEDRRGDSRREMYDERDLSKAYDEGFEDGMRNQVVSERQERRENYKHFTFGVYGGANSTRFEGETVNGEGLTGRLGYQLGFLVRGGGRVYGQVGAEYLASSSQFFQAGDGQVTGVSDITGNIDQRYLHIPAYIGVKLAQSDRGVSGIRLAVGAEYATPLSTDKNDFNLGNADFQAATVNGLANLGFDAGPIMLDFVYHYGFADVLTSGNSKRRILGVNLGFKF
ncbi:hypothetical protein [Spirosoma fluviale]|uniref:Outer membrane protein beta-barrel domain-containing protein n=1 Tax=Spirosoma fluviale TaxID=1597977 RepID=A0A286F6F5_9BACT|nr:hypothetical protein [Spirosoma fluviale]SOD78474.1 hypothetical protein SAMN06269250_0480 [Spirosoma fluviale]